MAQFLFGSQWATLATSLLGVAVVVLVVAAFMDRARGRRRCPKCWYDMRGVEGLRCPECGRQCRCEHELFRTRRRLRRGILAAAVLAVMSYVVGNWPRIEGRGLLGVVPTMLIAGTVPLLIDDVGPDLLQPGTTASKPGDRLYIELHNRIRNGDLWRLHWHVLVRQCMGRGPAELLAHQQPGTVHRYRQLLLIAEQSGALLRMGVQGQVADLVHIKWHTRPKYLRGSPVYAYPIAVRWDSNTDLEVHADPLSPDARRVRVSIPTAQQQLRGEYQACIIGVASSDVPLRHRIQVFRSMSDVYSVRVRRPQAVCESSVTFQVVDHIDDVLAPVRSADFDRKLAAMLQPRLVVTSEKVIGAKIAMTSPHRVIGLAGIDTMYGTIEVLRDDVVLARTYVVWSKISGPLRISGPMRDDMETLLYVAPPDTDALSWAETDGARANLDRWWFMSQPIHGDQSLWSAEELRSGRWRLRLVHEPALPISSFGALTRWVGEIEMPLEVDVQFGGQP